MSETPPIPETPKHRQDKEFEDPHYHDEDEVAPVEDAERTTASRIPPGANPSTGPNGVFKKSESHSHLRDDTEE